MWNILWLFVIKKFGKSLNYLFSSHFERERRSLTEKPIYLFWKILLGKGQNMQGPDQARAGQGQAQAFNLDQDVTVDYRLGLSPLIWFDGLLKPWISTKTRFNFLSTPTLSL